MRFIKLFEGFVPDAKSDVKSEFKALDDSLFITFVKDLVRKKGAPTFEIPERYSVSFRDDDHTPMGIYFYPISFVKSHIREESPGLVFDKVYRGRGQNMVFAKFEGNIVTGKKQKHDRRSLATIEREINSRYKPGRKSTVTDFSLVYSEMDRDTLRKAILAIGKKFGASRSTHRYLRQHASDSLKDEAALLYYKIMVVAEKMYIVDGVMPQENFRNICLKIGIDGFYDPGLGYIHGNEPAQAVIFDTEKIRVKGMIDKKGGQIKKF